MVTASLAGLLRDLSATMMQSAAGYFQPRTRHAQQLHGAHVGPDQRVGEIGRSGEVVGDAAKQDAHGAAPREMNSNTRDLLPDMLSYLGIMVPKPGGRKPGVFAPMTEVTNYRHERRQRHDEWIAVRASLSSAGG